MTSDHEQLKHLGEAIRAIRKEKDLTVEALATAASTIPEQLRTLENGELDPEYELLISLADSLSISAATLIGRAASLGGESGRLRGQGIVVEGPIRKP